MQVLFIIDPIESLTYKKDTSIVFMQQCLKCDYEVFFGYSCDLTIAKTVNITAHSLNNIDLTKDQWWQSNSTHTKQLNTFDWIMMRVDPPVNIDYINTTYILDLAVKQGAKVINNPTALRSFNEKITALHYPQFAPISIVSKQKSVLLEFLHQHRQVVIKPLDGMGGEGIFQIRIEDKNTNAIIDTATEHQTRFVMMQQLIEKYSEGDKRVLLVGGKVIPTGLLRIPKEGESRANLAQGGGSKAIAVTAKEQKVALQIAQDLLKQGVIFAGLDFIDEFLTEVNVTSPTCVKEIQQETNLPIAQQLLDSIIEQS